MLGVGSMIIAVLFVIILMGVLFVLLEGSE